MLFLYSILYTLGVIVMLPRFMFRGMLGRRRSGGLMQRLGRLPKFDKDERPVIWLHCVSVGETNAARPLVDELLLRHPEHRLIVLQ